MTAEPGAPRVLFRCDAGMQIGSGHVMRCLTLAEALSAQGVAITFACSGESVETVPALRRSNHPVMPLGDPLDLGEVMASGNRWDAAVIDHYGLDASYETELRDAAPAILAIDDLADRPHDCDILLDQTLGRKAADYTALVTPATRLLLGPEFALLRPEFARARPAALAARGSGGAVRRILVSLGMTDIGGITARAVKAAQAAGLEAEIAVAVGSRAESLPELRAMAAANPRVVLHVDCTDICTLMAESDLAIGAGGMTSWERCCLGLPTVLLVLAENQRENATRVAQLGAVDVLDTADLDSITEHIDILAPDSTRRAAMSVAGASLVDGLGAGRVAQKLTSLAALGG